MCYQCLPGVSDKLLLEKIVCFLVGERRVILQELFLAETLPYMVEQVLDVVLGLSERLAAVCTRGDQRDEVQPRLEVVVNGVLQGRLQQGVVHLSQDLVGTVRVLRVEKLHDLLLLLFHLVGCFSHQPVDLGKESLRLSDCPLSPVGLNLLFSLKSFCRLIACLRRRLILVV